MFPQAVLDRRIAELLITLPRSDSIQGLSKGRPPQDVSRSRNDPQSKGLLQNKSVAGMLADGKNISTKSYPRNAVTHASALCIFTVLADGNRAQLQEGETERERERERDNARQSKEALIDYCAR